MDMFTTKCICNINQVSDNNCPSFGVIPRLESNKQCSECDIRVPNKIKIQKKRVTLIDQLNEKSQLIDQLSEMEDDTQNKYQQKELSQLDDNIPTEGEDRSCDQIPIKYSPYASPDFHAAGAENALWKFTESDFLNSNCSFDDPLKNFKNGELQGSDGLPLRRVIVEDLTKERRIVDSVILETPCSFKNQDPDVTVPNSNKVSNSVLACPQPQSNQPNVTNDSGTEYSVLTLDTAKEWSGKAIDILSFQGVAGDPFSVYGGDDLIGYIMNERGEWIEKNFG